MKKDYYLGLDMGTGSVGWAVTDEEYNLCKFKKKDMWGIRLFEGAETAADRREFRSSRRRLQRRKQRIDLLQEIFASEMAKVDDTFFLRLNESRLHLEDKTTSFKYPLFIDKEYTDINYYREYRTIFHLRKELIVNPQPHDIRLIYLALHHILKSRGHFLIEGDLSAARDFKFTFDSMVTDLSEELNLDINSINEETKNEFEQILTDKHINKSTKARQLEKLFALDKNSFEAEEYKRQKNIIEQCCKFMVGNKGDIVKLFGLEKNEVEISSFSFAEASYDENRENLDNIIPEKAYLLDKIKSIYDWSILVDILQNEDYISFAKVKQYQRHGENLKLIRKMIKKYSTKDIYKDFFDNPNSKDNYASYIGFVKLKGKKYSVAQCAEEDFYKKLKGILGKITVLDQKDEEVLNDLLAGVERKDLLPLQRSKDNATVPYQVHEIELKHILKNASMYLPFLNEKDEQGISNIEKIEKIFKYRVPYFVGPLSDRHKDSGSHVWVVRKKQGKIYPWNIEEIVDYEKSNQEFIERMTNKCTYLIGEDVLPKNSLLYSKYMVLNELNNLKIKGQKVSENLKQSIYRDLFEKKSKVTGKAVLEYLKKDLPELKKEDLSGFDEKFNTSLTSYLDFKNKVFGEQIEQLEVQEMVENIIRWATIYGGDKKMLKKVINNEYKDKINDEQIKAILKLRYSGWGNFSKKFLTEIMGSDKETGEIFNIIDAMWITNNNLMQVLSGKFTFSEEIDKENKGKIDYSGKISYDSIVKDLYVSPATKRTIWQTIQIAEEVKKIMGKEPKKIFIEMARGKEKDKKGKKTQSRKEKLIELYKNCEIDTRDWIKELESREERDFNSLKLFLYYTQMGRCMYTGEEIDLDQLLAGNSKWDRDHIYPQSKIKDDSLDNLVLVNKTVNTKKSNELLSSEYQNKMHGFWKSLLDKELISKKKYDRLTRKGDFTEEELSGFISRQLVETRQSSKAVADVFKNIYENSEIVYVKAGLVSNFRRKPLNHLKSRRINDYHHAKDAYLNIVVGNVYHTKFTSNPINWFRKNKNTNYSLNAVFKFDIYQGENCIWQGYKEEGDECIGGTIDKVRKIMEQDNILYTEYSYCETGELFNATIKRKNQGAKIRIKANLDPEKYGGYYSPNTSYFACIEFDGKKKGERVKNIIGVPIYIDNMLKHNPNAFLEYCQEIKELKNVTILYPKIKKNSLLVVDGYPMRIRGENESNLLLKNNLQLKLEKKDSKLIRLIEKYLQKNYEYDVNEKLDKVNSQKLEDIYDVLLQKMRTTYKGRPSNQVKNLEVAKESFVQLGSLKDKMIIIDNMITLLRCDNETKADLSTIGGSKYAGGMAANKNTIGKSKLTLVNQSITGLFENRIEL